MIAMNYRKFPEAMALQMPLQFGRLLVWATSRPTTRILRAIRAERGAAFKGAGRIAYPVKPSTPSWAKEAAAKARALAKSVKQACIALDFLKPTATAAELAAMNPYRRMLERMRAGGAL